MDEILYRLCRHSVGIMDGWHPFPATLIAEMLGMSVHKVRYHLRKLTLCTLIPSIHKVRYHLRKLKKKGLVESFHEGGMTEDGEVYCLWGWTITKATHSTEEYKKAYEEERNIVKECFDFDIGEPDSTDKWWN